MKPEPLPENFDRIHVDGDILIYGICSVCEYCARFDDDLDVVFCNIHEALSMVRGAMDKYAAIGKGQITIYFTGSGNFRKDLFPQYKAHRKKVRKPAGYAALKAEINKSWTSVVEDGLEADDLIGMAHTRALGLGLTSLIVSEDKDFNTIPGWRYNPEKDQFSHISPEDADRNWLLQTMIGDRTDGYPGLEGVGPVSAERLLRENGASWKTVENAFTDSGFTPEYALVQARMARILRDGEYDFNNKEVKLWRPETT